MTAFAELFANPTAVRWAIVGFAMFSAGAAALSALAFRAGRVRRDETPTVQMPRPVFLDETLVAHPEPGFRRYRPRHRYPLHPANDGHTVVLPRIGQDEGR